jgi:hypothetical protein
MGVPLGVRLAAEERRGVAGAFGFVGVLASSSSWEGIAYSDMSVMPSKFHDCLKISARKPTKCSGHECRGMEGRKYRASFVL